MDMRFLMKQAQAMQQKLLDAQQNLRAEGTAGGGSVKVTLNGSKELVGLSIAKDAIDPEDPSLLEDLITAAFRDAAQKAELYKALELAKAAPDTRADRVAALKAKIDDPSYIDDAVISMTADRILDQLLG